MPAMPTKAKIDAPERWLSDYGDLLFRYALVRVSHREVAEDLVQMTLLEALRARGRFRGASAVSTWLVGILRHKILDHYRSLGRTHTRKAGGDDRQDPGKQRHGPGPEKAAEDDQAMKALQGCLEGLSARQRAAFSLRELEGLGTRKICGVLGISSSNLWVILHRARLQLSDCLHRKGIRPTS